MNSLKRVTAALAVATLPLVLFSFGTLSSLNQVLGSPTTVKDALRDSGLYTSLVGEALDKATSTIDAGTAAIPVEKPEVQAIIQDAVPPSYIEQQTNGVVDKVYSWLHADSDKLAVSVDLQDAQSKLAEGLAGYTTTYMDALPACPAGTNVQPIIDDPLRATCLPAGYDTVAAAERVRTTIADNPGLLPSTTLTTDNAQTAEGQSINNQLDALPNLYEQVQWAMWGSAIVALLCILAILTLSTTRRGGIKKLAVISLTVGIVSAILAWGIGFALTMIVSHMASDSGANALHASIIKAIELVTHDIRNWWSGYGLILTAIGVGILIALRLTRVPPEQVVDLTAPPPQLPVAPADSATAAIQQRAIEDQADQARRGTTRS